MNELSKCLCCGSSSLEQVLDLGDQPLANSYHNGETLPYYPLCLNLCSNCWHLQLSHAVNPDLMFRDYKYVSGTSNTLKEYFKWFAEYTLQFKPSAKTILDIACNDGTQLDVYKERGLSTYGIDPAKNLLPISTEKGHKVFGEYLTKNYKGKFNSGFFDIIVAQNVFAHNSYPLEFLEICKELVSEKGHIFIQTSQANMVKNNEFDTIYHEHISFFNINSMKELVGRSGLYLNDVIKTDIHGTSFVFVLSKSSKKSLNIDNEINLFNSDKLNSIETYSKYKKNSFQIVKELKRSIDTYKSKGHLVIGYGAAAKGNTLLNFGKINLDYIIDDNPFKQELLTPGMNIPIKSLGFLNSIEDSKPIVFVPLAWNFYTEIKNNIKSVRNTEDIFIKYFPEIIIE